MHDVTQIMHKHNTIIYIKIIGAVHLSAGSKYNIFSSITGRIDDLTPCIKQTKNI